MNELLRLDSFAVHCAEYCTTTHDRLCEGRRAIGGPLSFGWKSSESLAFVGSGSRFLRVEIPRSYQIKPRWLHGMYPLEARFSERHGCFQYLHLYRDLSPIRKLQRLRTHSIFPSQHHTPLFNVEIGALRDHFHFEQQPRHRLQ